MKITETIDRECCDCQKDLKPCQCLGLFEHHHAKFCVHCGQIWVWHRSLGEMDYGYEPVNIIQYSPKENV